MIDESTYKRMPAELQALFLELPDEREAIEDFLPDSVVQMADNREGFSDDLFGGGSKRPGAVIGKELQSYSRFFFCGKASRSEREAGFDKMEVRVEKVDGDSISLIQPRANTHPTIKPIELMRWLVRLVTPPGGVVLDPFLGTGTTCIAAEKEGFGYMGIEQNEEYHGLAVRRIAHWSRQSELEF